MSGWRDPSASAKAKAMHTALLKHEFVVSLITLEKILAVTKPVAAKLQKVDKNIVACVQDINLCIDVLNVKRKEVDQQMNDFKQVLMSESLEMPRTTGRQRNRPNVVVNTPKNTLNGPL